MIAFQTTHIKAGAVSSDAGDDQGRVCVLAQLQHGSFNWHITPAEARELAAALLLHADRIEQPSMKEAA
jgi:hypothetical protein